MLTAIWILALLVAFFALAYLEVKGAIWSITALVALVAAWLMRALPGPLWLVLCVAFALLAPAFLIPRLRRTLLSDGILKLYKRVLPAMSQTEQDAIDAGTVWWDADLFSGKPDWHKLLNFPKPHLSPEEQRFIDRECEELCRMSPDWETTSLYQDLSPNVWQFIKEKGFLGMIIPKKYGGLEFSAYAHSQVIQKLATRCSALTVTVMVPNSLGPGELLMQYGTDEQKNYFLPRLARGKEIPCFALTAPSAGSDAASISDSGIVCKGEYDGKTELGLRLTWEKRYITLGPVATLLGLAFRVYDPDHLLGDKEDLGITCALIPTSHPGVNIGHRHFPLNAVFQNGPNWGKDVFIPLHWVIGGQEQVGQGWKMLMNSLAAGRSISLPASSVGSSKLAVRATGAYARIRAQFNTSIGKFEGVEEALARMGGNLYIMDAARVMTAGSIDAGERPAVVSAIVKYHLTERARVVINDAMDVLGGKGICLGPNNFMGRAYQQIPISITVEGANILTRSLIIFGQGAIRCHPFVLKEIAATREIDPDKASTDFDAALFGHIRFSLRNIARSLVLGLSGSHLVRVPEGVAKETRRYVQQITRFAAALAFLTDVSMLVLGGGLKRREKLSARLGDILSLLYLCSSAIKRYEDEGRQTADQPLLDWAIWDAMFRAQNAFEGVISNYPSRAIGWLLRRIVFPLGRPYAIPSDSLGHEVAMALIEPSLCRDRLTAGAFVPRTEDEALGVLELGLEAKMAAERILQDKLQPAAKAGKLPGKNQEEWARIGLEQGLITFEEDSLLKRARRLADEVIRVDHFPRDLDRSEMQQLDGPTDRVAA